MAAVEEEYDVLEILQRIEIKISFLDSVFMPRTWNHAGHMTQGSRHKVRDIGFTLRLLP